MYNSRNDRNDRGPSSWGGPKKFGGPKPWDRGGDRGGRGGDREDREMFKATCSECGDMCQVPFRPRDGRPVFCNNCFKKDGDTGASFERRPSFEKSRDFGFREDRASERPRAENNGGNQDQFKALNSKLDTLIKMLSTIIPAPTEHIVKPSKEAKKEAVAKEAPLEIKVEAPKKVAKKKATAKAKKA